MPKFLCADFLKSETEYAQCICFWEESFKAILGEDFSAWRIWLNNRWQGDPDFDGNPVYSLIRKDQSKAIRISQWHPGSQFVHITSWSECFGKGLLSEPIPTLSVWLELSMESFHIAEKLISSWVGWTSSFESFETVINEYITPENYKGLESYDNSIEGTK